MPGYQPKKKKKKKNFFFFFYIFFTNKKRRGGPFFEGAGGDENLKINFLWPYSNYDYMRGKYFQIKAV